MMTIRSAVLGLAGMLCLMDGTAQALPIQPVQAPTAIERAAVVTRIVRRRPIFRRPAVIVRRRVIVR
jgi:hypothetical protein